MMCSLPLEGEFAVAALVAVFAVAGAMEEEEEEEEEEEDEEEGA